MVPIFRKSCSEELNFRASATRAGVEIVEANIRILFWLQVQHKPMESRTICSFLSLSMSVDEALLKLFLDPTVVFAYQQPKVHVAFFMLTCTGRS